MTKSILVLTFSLVLCFELAALEVRNVDSLSQGTCWIAEEAGSVQLVSFSQKLSADIGSYQLQNFFESKMGLAAGDLVALKSYVHCSSHSLALVFNIQTQKGSSCVWADIGSEGLTLRDHGHMGAQESDGFCDGAKFGELIVMTKLNQQLIPLQNELEQVLGAEAKFEVKQLGERIFKVVLPQQLHGQESVVRDRLLESQGLLDSLRAVEYSPFYHPVGEVRELQEFRY